MDIGVTTKQEARVEQAVALTTDGVLKTLPNAPYSVRA